MSPLESWKVVKNRSRSPHFAVVNTLPTGARPEFLSMSCTIHFDFRTHKSRRYCSIATLIQPHFPSPFLPSLRSPRYTKDAVRHIARIHRVLNLKRGNLMLVGVGGSGRQSLTRLAAYISGQEMFMIEITKNYRQV